MLNKLKFAAAIAAVSVALAITSPLTGMFGKHYRNDQDFTCCKNNQLVIHHYYTTRAFWVDLNQGYEMELIGKPSPGCNVSCDE